MDFIIGEKRMSVNIGIIGSRRRNTQSDFLVVRDEVLRLVEIYGKDEIIIVSGGCPKGGDKFAERIAKELGIKDKMIIHHPDKKKLNKQLLRSKPRAAYAIINYARNSLIAQDSHILIACVANDRKGGTEDTIKKYLKLKKEELILI